MGLSWQQGPLSTGAIGRFLVPEPLPKKLLYVEPLRRRMRVRFGGIWIADSEHVLLHWVTSIHHGDDAMHTVARRRFTLVSNEVPAAHLSAAANRAS
jgi:hypothetical protein